MQIIRAGRGEALLCANKNIVLFHNLLRKIIPYCMDTLTLKGTAPMTNRFTENARRVLADAARTAGELGHAHIGSEHILLAITLDGESTAMRVLRGEGITSDGVRRRLIALLGMGESCVLTADDMTPLCKKLLLDSSVCSRSQRYGFIGSEHLLMAMLREDCNGRRIIETEGADVKRLYASLERMFSDDASYGAASPEMRRAERRRCAPTVERNGVDLTARAEEGRIEPLVGREAELDRIVSILLRKTKNNPVLIGEAGVGKTAIVEIMTGIRMQVSIF